MATAAADSRVCLSEILKWVDTHPFEFEELVAQKATVTAIHRWQDAHSAQYGGKGAGGQQRNKLSVHQPTYKPCVTVPNGPRIEVDPSIVNRVSCMVKRPQAGFRPPSINTENVARCASGDCSHPVKGVKLEANNVLHDVCSTLDLETLGRKICRDVPLLVNAERAYLHLRHQTHDTFIRFTSLGSNEVTDSVLAQHVIAGDVGFTAVRGTTDVESVEQAFTNDTTMRNFVAAPIHSRCGKTFGAIQVVNKQGSTESFTLGDLEQIEIFAGFCATAISNAQMFQQALLECQWSNVLLELARNLFEDLDTIEHVVTKIMVNAAALLSCEKCSVFMVDRESQELYAKVFDVSPGETKLPLPICSLKEIRFPMDAGIAGHVATTGETLNIANAYGDPRFNQEIDTKTGFKTKSILCMPIFNSHKVVIGVAQLLNKQDGVFSSQDEHLFDAFGVYCGLSLTAVGLYEDLQKADAKNHVTMDVLSFHACASEEDATRMSKITVPTSNRFGLLSLEMDVKALSKEDTAVACLRMFADMGFIHTFKIPYQSLCRWILSVQNNYREVAYHNWHHAFNVTQAMYAILMKAELNQHLSPLERLGLIISCMCHDLDHRGTNNTFEGLKKSNLATLYGTSTLERHHFDMCLLILSTEGNNILVNLGVNDYRSIINIMENAILATDISVYLKTRSTYHNLVAEHKFDWDNTDHRTLLCSMLMTSSDLSSILRPWEIQQRVAETVYTEFHQQGDEEREMGHKPGELHDKNNAQKLPKMQLGFIDFICKPIYVSLALQFPEIQEYVDALMTNRNHWDLMQKSGVYKMSVKGPPPTTVRKRATVASSCSCNSAILRLNLEESNDTLCPLVSALPERMAGAPPTLPKRRITKMKTKPAICTIM